MNGLVLGQTPPSGGCDYSLSMFHMPCTHDQSVAVLQEIFGNAVATLTGGMPGPANGFLIPDILAHFNAILLTALVVIYSFMLVVGTINTAHEGTFLGRQWSSVWTPIRSFVGPILLLPTSSGLCGIQMIFLSLILYGVNMGTAVWNKSIQDIVMGVSPTTPTAMYGMVQDAAANAFLASAMGNLMKSYAGQAPGGMPSLPGGRYAIPFEDKGVLVSELRDPQVYEDIRQSMMNLCSAAYLVVDPTYQKYMTYGCNIHPMGDASGCSPSNLPSTINTGLGLTAVGSVAELTGDEQVGVRTCFQNVATMLTPQSSMTNSGRNINASFHNETSTANQNNQQGYWGGWIGSNIPQDSDLLQAQHGFNAYSFKGVGLYEIVGDGSGYHLYLDPQYNDYPWDCGEDNHLYGLIGLECFFSHLAPRLTDNPVPSNPMTFSVTIDNAGTVWLHSAGLGMWYGERSGGAKFLFNVGAALIPNVVNGLLLPSTQTPGPDAPNDQRIRVSVLGYGGLSKIADGTVRLTQGGAIYTPPTPAGAGEAGRAALIKSIDDFATDNVVNDGCHIDYGDPLAKTYNPSTQCSMSKIIGDVTKAAQEAMAKQKPDQQIKVNKYADIYGHACADPSSAACQKAIQDQSFNSPNQVSTAMNSSWWYAGQVYLQIDQMLADNLGDLYKQFQGLGSQDGFANFQSGITANVGMAVGHYAGEGSHNFAGVPFSFGMMGHKSGPNYDHLAVMNFSNSYTYVTGMPGWESDIGVFNPKNYSLDPDTGNADPLTTALGGVWNLPYNVIVDTYQLLQLVPPPMQLSIQTLLRSSFFSGHHTDDVLQTEIAWALHRALVILNVNGLLSTPAQQASELPAKEVIDKIFSNLLGPDGGSVSTGLDNIMNEVYGFGEIDFSGNKNIVGQNLSVISNAQRVGIDVILNVIGSVAGVYSHFQRETSSMVSEVESIQKQAQIASGTLEGLSFIAAMIDAGCGPFCHTAGWASSFSMASDVAVQWASYKIQYKLLIKNNQLSQQLMYLPLVSVILLMMFSIGISFALLIPLIPFILFWGGQIGWLLSCIEAMVAAPLVMLALTFPGGHEVVGHSTQGLKMFLGVIFRPVLMVIGMLIAIVLTYIVITISAQGFHLVGSAIIGGIGLDGQPIPGMISDAIDPQRQARGILSLFLLFLYSQFIIKAFNKCFSTIYVLPEKVMQWMGAHGDRHGADDLQEISSSLSSAVQQVGQAGSQGLQSGIGGQQQYMSGSGRTGGEKLGQSGKVASSYGQSYAKAKHEGQSKEVSSADKAGKDQGTDA